MLLSLHKKQKITSDTKFDKPVELFAKNRKPDAKKRKTCKPANRPKNGQKLKFQRPPEMDSQYSLIFSRAERVKASTREDGDTPLYTIKNWGLHGSFYKF